MEDLFRQPEVVVRVPMVDDVECLIADLASSGVAATTRPVGSPALPATAG